jgi:hypothetical protein
MIEWCNKKGYEFIIITEENLKRFNVWDAYRRPRNRI